MIQLGTLGNFFHAIWLDRIWGDLKLENKNCVGKDNAIAVGKDLKKDLETAVALNPDIIVAGKHGCRINCNECCDAPAYKSRIVRRYCEYLTEVGNYCIVKLAGQKADNVCENWFCDEFCESSIDHYSGVSPEVPLIHNPGKFYLQEQKREFILIASALQNGISVEQVPLLGARGREVALYKTAKNALLKTAEGKAAMLIEYDKFEEAEDLMGNNLYFEMLKEWEEMYCRRKGITREE
ncbi:MAG: hypothetical protein PHO02_02540 [Candidatus Nanoarchaeia archaeon]|nr:hypothetical protein [Candidatus Nanoarchaeia archaeon]